MTFTTAGKNRIRDLFDADINHGQLGTDTTTPAATDTTLGAASAATSLAVTTQTADKQVVVDYNLPSTAAQGSTFGEYGFFNSSNTMFARFIFSTLTHASTDQWQISVRNWID